MTAKKLDAALFQSVYELISHHSWLEDRNPQIIDLVNECDTTRQQKLVLDLLSRFKFANSKDLGDSATAIVLQITGNWTLSPKDTVIVAIADKEESDGSQFLLKALAQKFPRSDGWDAKNFLGHITTIGGVSPEIRHIVLVDDFIGSGKKISRKVKWVIDTLTLKNVEFQIHVCSMAAMTQSKIKLDLLNVKYFSSLWLSKGISDFYHGADLTAATDDMTELEKKLKELSPDLKFGFKKSETLYYLEPYNVPNNVFPVFWWERSMINNHRNALLNRGAA
jgi:hypothetical protein